MAFQNLTTGIEITADDFLFAGFPADIIVHNTEACHVNTHVGR